MNELLDSFNIGSNAALSLSGNDSLFPKQYNDSLNLTVSDDDIRNWSGFGALSTEPSGFMPFEFEPVEESASNSLQLDIDSLSDLNDFSAITINPYASAVGAAQNPTQAMNQSNLLWGDFLASARADKQTANALNIAASAGDLFDSIIRVNTGISNANMAAQNARMAADNQIMAIDNRTMYVKGQLQNRFNNLLAQTQVRQAARGLKVSAASTLEANKETAYDLTMDYATLDTNANLEKIRLENEKSQANIAADFAKNQQWANLIGSLGAFGFTLGTTNFGSLLDKGSLSEAIYGRK